MLAVLLFSRVIMLTEVDVILLLVTFNVPVPDNCTNVYSTVWLIVAFIKLTVPAFELIKLPLNLLVSSPVISRVPTLTAKLP